MASLALGVIGASIGNFAFAGASLFGMSSASIGWSIGAELGGALIDNDEPAAISGKAEIEHC